MGFGIIPNPILNKIITKYFYQSRQSDDTTFKIKIFKKLDIFSQKDEFRILIFFCNFKDGKWYYTSMILN